MQRTKLTALMIFHLLWGSVLWLSISKLGLGLSTDSVHMLFAAQNLSEGRGLVSFDGSPVLAWPPLYPMLLAALHLVTGLGTFAAAHFLQVAAFIGLSICTSLLFLRIFPDNFGLALAGSVLSDLGVGMVVSFDLVGSDYVHLFLVVLCLLLAAHYVEHGSARVYVALFLAAMLAMLQRFLGVAAILTAAVSILWFARAALPQRIVRSLFLLLAAAPAVAWYALSSPLVERRAPVSFINNLATFSGSMTEWFVPPWAVEGHAAARMLGFWVVLIVLLGILYVARKTALTSFAAPVLLFGAIYTLTLFATASLTFYNKLAGRFLLPLYIPFIVLLLGALNALLDALRPQPQGARVGGRLIAAGMLALMAILLLRATLPAVLLSHAGVPGVSENVFNTVEWRRNPALAFWRSHKPAGSFLLISNQPDGVAFYAQHQAGASPRQYSGPYGKTEFPVESYASELFASGQDVYLVWIEPEDRGYYYSPRDLRAVAKVRELYSGDGGAVYRLTPKPGD